MRIDLDANIVYNLDQEEAIGERLHTNGLADANSTSAPIKDECYDAQPDDAEMLNSSCAALAQQSRSSSHS